VGTGGPPSGRAALRVVRAGRRGVRWVRAVAARGSRWPSRRVVGSGCRRGVGTCSWVRVVVRGRLLVSLLPALTRWGGSPVRVAGAVVHIAEDGPLTRTGVRLHSISAQQPSRRRRAGLASPRPVHSLGKGGRHADRCSPRPGSDRLRPAGHPARPWTPRGGSGRRAARRDAIGADLARNRRNSSIGSASGRPRRSRRVPVVRGHSAPGCRGLGRLVVGVGVRPGGCWCVVVGVGARPGGCWSVVVGVGACCWAGGRPCRDGAGPLGPADR
jgi:hypothetical protein